MRAIQYAFPILQGFGSEHLGKNAYPPQNICKIKKQHTDIGPLTKKETDQAEQGP